MNDFLKMSKTLGIVVAILMIILGGLIFFAPMFAAQMIMWFFIAGLLIFGIFHIIIFAKSEIKNGWSLTSGIMAVLLGVLLIFSDPLVPGQHLGLYAGVYCLIHRYESNCRFLGNEKTGGHRNRLVAGIRNH